MATGFAVVEFFFAVVFGAGGVTPGGSLSLATVCMMALRYLQLSLTVPVRHVEIFLYACLLTEPPQTHVLSIHTL